MSWTRTLDRSSTRATRIFLAMIVGLAPILSTIMSSPVQAIEVPFDLHVLDWDFSNRYDGEPDELLAIYSVSVSGIVETDTGLIEDFLIDVVLSPTAAFPGQRAGIIPDVVKTESVLVSGTPGNPFDPPVYEDIPIANDLIWSQAFVPSFQTGRMYITGLGTPLVGETLAIDADLEVKNIDLVWAAMERSSTASWGGETVALDLSPEVVSGSFSSNLYPRDCDGGHHCLEAFAGFRLTLRFNLDGTLMYGTLSDYPATRSIGEAGYDPSMTTNYPRFDGPYFPVGPGGGANVEAIPSPEPGFAASLALGFLAISLSRLGTRTTKAREANRSARFDCA